jgi:hypothetical protein
MKARRFRLANGHLGVKGDAYELVKGARVQVESTDGRDGGFIRVGEIVWKGGGVTIARVAPKILSKFAGSRALASYLGPNSGPPRGASGVSSRLRKAW